MTDLLASVRQRADRRIIPANATIPSRRRGIGLAGTVLLGIVIAAMLGSRAMLAWVQSQPDGSPAAILYPAATIWNGGMQRIGMTGLDLVLHRNMQSFATSKFPGTRQSDQ